MRMASLLRETREFNQMLDAITPEQLHGEICFGEPVCSEIAPLRKGGLGGLNSSLYIPQK